MLGPAVDRGVDGHSQVDERYRNEYEVKERVDAGMILEILCGGHGFPFGAGAKMAGDGMIHAGLRSLGAVKLET